ncbi:hypothetical protein BpHYR1_040493 [Brachionus plicatilis]|uniref:Uncharacterized protein n=1 Tax=Brachionus plicatilis TaxID=10195 RepID=A0A3M7RJT1_BRAPC|nr:hypothetical protein BpHYR1_040493 [Brachionus plicatilis]
MILWKFEKISTFGLFFITVVLTKVKRSFIKKERNGHVFFKKSIPIPSVSFNRFNSITSIPSVGMLGTDGVGLGMECFFKNGSPFRSFFRNGTIQYNFLLSTLPGIVKFHTKLPIQK